MMNSQLVMHAVPKVLGDRICYAFFMNKHVFKRFKVQLPDPAVLPAAEHDVLRQEENAPEDGDDEESGGSDEDADGSADEEENDDE